MDIFPYRSTGKRPAHSHFLTACRALYFWSIHSLYRRILGPVYDNEKENWRILTNKEIYACVKKPNITDTRRLNRLRWFGHVQRMEEKRIPKRVLYMNLGTRRLTGRPRSRWHDEVWKDIRIVGGEGWQEWKKIVRTARNPRILNMPME